MALTKRQRDVVVALGDTLFPAHGDAHAGGEILPEAFDEFLPSIAEEKQKALGTVLNLFDSAAIFRYGRRFRKLSPARRTRYLEGWMRSRLPIRRIIYRTLRETCVLLYYQDRRSWPAIGYAGPPAREA